MVEIVRVTLPGLPITLGWLNRFHQQPYYAMHPVRSTGRHFRRDKARSNGLNFRSHRGATNKELWEEAMPTETDERLMKTQRKRAMNKKMLAMETREQADVRGLLYIRWWY